MMVSHTKKADELGEWREFPVYVHKNTPMQFVNLFWKIYNSRESGLSKNVEDPFPCKFIPNIRYNSIYIVVMRITPFRNAPPQILNF